MAVLNKFGLSREIPASVKLQIRKECGFGCVCCGIAIATYEHIDPEFQNAHEHDPKKMAYLCAGCHDRVTRKFWSKDRIKEARLNPWCIANGKCRDEFDIFGNELVLWMGTNKIINIETIISLDDEPFIKIEKPEFSGGPFRLSGSFYDNDNNLLFRIKQNEWFGESNVWDIECVGGSITIRSKSRKIALKLHTIPPFGIIFETINMFYHGFTITADPSKFLITTPMGNGLNVMGGRSFEGFDQQNVSAFSFYTDGRFVVGGGIRIGQINYKDVPVQIKNWLKEANNNKPGRNDPCSCGSGLKNKKCCDTG